MLYDCRTVADRDRGIAAAVEAVKGGELVVLPTDTVYGVGADAFTAHAVTALHPHDPVLDRWLQLYSAVARRNGGEPDAARHLLSWVHAAGLRDVTPSTSSWCFATPADREWWGTSWAGRATASAFAEQAVASGLASEAELQVITGATNEMGFNCLSAR